MKKLTTIIITLVFALVTNLSGQNQTRDLADIDGFITNYMDANHKPGLSACIIKGDSIVWRGNYGYADVANSTPVTKDKLFYAYSIGKSITAASIMKLWENNLIGLDENVNDFLPFQIINPFNGSGNFTPRMLMTHTSSIIDVNLNGYVTTGDPTITLEYFLENYLSTGGAFFSPYNFSNSVPGNEFHYSNFGSALNGYLAEALLNLPFKDYAGDSILVPLEMEESAWFLDEINIDNLAYGYLWEGTQYVPYPHYGHPAYPGLTLKSSSEELAHYVTMLINGGNYQNNQILEEATVDTICSSYFNSSLGEVGLGLFENTLNCANEDKVIWGHKGGGTNGYASEIQFCPEENIGIVYMSNSENYVLPILQRLFEYGALIVISEDATNISESGFTANWQEAPDAVEYYLDVAYDWMFTNYVEGYENINVDLATSYDVLDSIEDEDQRFYRIRGYNGHEYGPYSSSVKVVFDSIYVNIDELPEPTLIDNFRCYPVPIKDVTAISYELKTNNMVTISLFNKIGQSVLEIYSGDQSKGEHHITFNSSALPSGIYFLLMKVGDELATKKVVKL